jgi:hypothetical protein
MSWGPWGYYREDYVPKLLKMQRGERRYFRPGVADLERLARLISARAAYTWGPGAVSVRTCTKSVEVTRK